MIIPAIAAIALLLTIAASAALAKPSPVDVTIAGNQEVIAGETMRINLKAANAADVELQDFYCAVRVPQGVWPVTLRTGTWTEPLDYEVWYKTAQSAEYTVLASQLSTTGETELDCSREALGLTGQDYVQELRLVFGGVRPGFQTEKRPEVVSEVCPELAQGQRITIAADAGGVLGGRRAASAAAWETAVAVLP